jgi:glycogen debranching enzyme
MRCETFGNILACIVGLADEKKQNLITDFMFRAAVNKPYPIKVLYPPIYPGEDDWKPYMAKGRQNYPWQYHNGGIWPFVGGFWVMWLGKIKHPKAEEELENLTKSLELYNWEFNEYLHGQYGTPMGIPNQSWSMAMYIGAYQSLTKS